MIQKIISLILIAAILKLQTISYNAQTLTLPDILLVILSVAAFIVMGILTLYTNGKLEKLTVESTRDNVLKLTLPGDSSDILELKMSAGEIREIFVQ